MENLFTDIGVEIIVELLFFVVCIISSSQMVYCWLYAQTLKLYPHDHQERFGREMIMTFAEKCQNCSRRHLLIILLEESTNNLKEASRLRFRQCQKSIVWMTSSPTRIYSLMCIVALCIGLSIICLELTTYNVSKGTILGVGVFSVAVAIVAAYTTIFALAVASVFHSFFEISHTKLPLVFCVAYCSMITFSLGLVFTFTGHVYLTDILAIIVGAMVSIIGVQTGLDNNNKESVVAS